MKKALTHVNEQRLNPVFSNMDYTLKINGFTDRYIGAEVLEKQSRKKVCNGYVVVVIEVVNDHCLNSTVSILQYRHGIKVQRKFETVPGYLGFKTRVCRYWIADEVKEAALKIANFWS